MDQVDMTTADERAEDWYNATPKQELLRWATEHGLDIGQTREILDVDWNDRVIDAYAAYLRAA